MRREQGRCFTAVFGVISRKSLEYRSAAAGVTIIDLDEGDEVEPCSPWTFKARNVVVGAHPYEIETEYGLFVAPAVRRVAASSGAILMPWIIGRVAEGAGLAAGMATNIIPCVGLCVFAVLVASQITSSLPVSSNAKTLEAEVIASCTIALRVK